LDEVGVAFSLVVPDEDDVGPLLLLLLLLLSELGGLVGVLFSAALLDDVAFAPELVVDTSFPAALLEDLASAPELVSACAAADVDGVDDKDDRDDEEEEELFMVAVLSSFAPLPSRAAGAGYASVPFVAAPGAVASTVSVAVAVAVTVVTSFCA
jgi:hypothetical protein